MNPRKKFLTSVFAALEENGVRYCVLRNYHNIYTAVDTDLDLLVSPYSVARFEKCLREAAAQNGFRLVHTARYVNFSHVYWHPQDGFTRVDFETEVRWRQLQVFNPRDVLDARVRHQEFFIPAPAHESVIVWVAAVWRAFLSDRYRRRLAELYAICPDKAELNRIFLRAFGAAGPALVDLQSRIASAEFSGALCWRVRFSLLANNSRPDRFLSALLRNVRTDARRLLQRLRRPAGVSLLFVSANRREKNFDELIRRVEFLFPAQKCIFQTFDLTTQSIDVTRWSFGLRWTRLRVLFKGGLFVRLYRLAHDTDLTPAIRVHARYLYPSRSFVCLEDSAGRLCFAHVKTGFMAMTDPSPDKGEADFNQSLVEFTADVMERETTITRGGRGIFCVLVGLDGSGKTTLARQLCNLAMHANQFRGSRYFHWRPGLTENVEFPLPDFRNTPRKKELNRNLANSLLSAARLARNVLLANLTYQLRIRPLLRQGYLVLIDRYFYNYYLDPISVKYYGPQWLLESVRKCFPRPDQVITLTAPAELLLQRKQELSESEIRRQSQVLQTLKFEAPRIIAADARLGPADVATRVMKEILKSEA